ncbi:MAG: cell division protein ZapA [Crocinitomicaceae bacterium]|nr:cell division protein ZapA [Crocinitomicaceae bacterium]|tara:strand:- start:284 stop:580 length:297 start_codon:yes stop_codon:yes gene_type:complete
MSHLSIKVTIANRVYPLTIRREEEELIRKAAKLVNDNIKELESNYAVRDKQDLLAMTALFYANRSLEMQSSSKGSDDSSSNAELQEVQERLKNYLDSL